MKKLFGSFILIAVILLLPATKRSAQGNAGRVMPAGNQNSAFSGEEAAFAAGAAAQSGVEGEIWTEAATFFGESGSYGAYGQAVDIGGDTAVIGDRFLSVDGVGHAGGVYVYERDSIDGHWFERTVLHAPTVQSCARFGSAVAITAAADTIIVGEPGSRDHPYCKQNGSIYFFGRDEGGPNQWGLMKVIDGTGHYGDPLLIEGDTLVVGVPGDTWDGGCDNGLAQRPEFIHGTVEIYRRDHGGEDTWGLVKIIQPPWFDDFDKHFGCSIALGGGRLLVGAPDYGEMGMAFLYDAEQDWQMVDTFEGYLRWNTFGYAVAVDEDDLFIGAPSEQICSGVDCHHVGKVYQDGTADWLPYPTLDETGDWGYRVGESLALDGDILAVSYSGTNQTELQRNALIYQQTEEGWELVQVLEDSGPDCGRRQTVALDGDSMIVSECPYGAGTHLVHIYERSSGGEAINVFLPMLVR